MPSSEHAKKTIGVVTWDFPPGAKGGLGRAMEEIKRALEMGGYRVEVLTPGTRTCPWVLRTIGALSPIIFSLFLSVTLQRWIDRHRIDVLLMPSGPGGLMIYKRPRNCVLYVVCYHTYAQQASAVPGQNWKRLFIVPERSTLLMADAVLCYSPDTRRVLFERYTIPADRIHLLPQIVTLDQWIARAPVQKQEHHCSCVARLEARKGVDVLLRAWTAVLKEIPTATLSIVGDGIQRLWIDRMIRRCTPSVVRVPSLPQEKIIELVHRSTLMICPSYLEGFGLAAVEAMAAGTAVVASDCDGLRSLIDRGETGWLVPPGDPRALAEAIVTMVRKHSLRAECAKRAFQAVHVRFEKMHAIEALHECVQSVSSIENV